MKQDEFNRRILEALDELVKCVSNLTPDNFHLQNCKDKILYLQIAMMNQSENEV